MLTLSFILSVATHQENLEKSWNLRVVREVREFKSGQGKVRENALLHERNLANWFLGKSFEVVASRFRF